MHTKVRFGKLGGRVCSVVLIACALLLVLPLGAQAQDPPPPWPPAPVCNEGWLGGQIILVCTPPGPPWTAPWNGALVVYAHGYVAPRLLLALPAGELGQIQMPGGVGAVDFILGQGFAFATTSYSKNGYAVGVAEDDLNALVDYFWTQLPLPFPLPLPPTTLLIGASEGGIITVQQVEKHSDIYQGGLAMCGPVGGMPAQIQYLGDFRVVFDQFFHSVFKFGAVDVPDDAYLDWGDYESKIQDVILRHPKKSAQLFQITRAAWLPASPATWVATAHQTLRYSVFATNDMIETAGGNPYDNEELWYTDAWNDTALNAKVERVEAWGNGTSYVAEHYQPTGDLEVPLVTLHNQLDPQVPYWHEAMYAEKYAEMGGSSALLVQYTAEEVQYGHCAFSSDEVLLAFQTLVDMALPPMP